MPKQKKEHYLYYLRIDKRRTGSESVVIFPTNKTINELKEMKPLRYKYKKNKEPLNKSFDLKTEHDDKLVTGLYHVTISIFDTEKDYSTQYNIENVNITNLKNDIIRLTF